MYISSSSWEIFSLIFRTYIACVFLLILSQSQSIRIIFICSICWPDYTGYGEGKGSIVPVHAVKAICGVEVELRLFLSSALDGGERSSSCPNHFMPQKEPQCRFSRRLGATQSQSSCFGEEINLLPLLGF